jgi:hypothetical protein
MNLADFPIEVLLTTREFLLNHIIETSWANEVVKNFIRRESERSWRNFLSVSHGEDWQRIRKHCMIWSLNRFASSKYLREKSFENFLHSQLVDPSRQLQLCYYQLLKEPMGSPTHLSDGRISFEQLHTLSLFSCEHILCISAPNLKTLKMVNCRKIMRFESMEKLTVAFVIDCPDNTLTLLPLEQLERVHFKGLIADLVCCSSRLLKLKNLTFESTTIGSSSSASFLQPLKNLESLATVNLQHCNVAGLSRLTLLDCSRSYTFTTVIGKEDIFPQLRDFHGRVTSALDLDCFQRPNLSAKVNLSLLEQGEVNKFVQEQPNIQELSLFYAMTQFAAVLGISQYDQVKTARVTLPRSISNNFPVIPLQFPPELQSFILSVHPTVIQLPIYPNLQRINVNNCFELRKIDSLANIPYITIDNCRKIEDFSCLGSSQRFLMMTSCPNLKNSDLGNFGNIPYLSISLCANITSIERTFLKNNRYLHFLDLENLQKIHLSGTSYVKVRIRSCQQLNTLKITGRVDVLNLYNCDKLVFQETTGNFDHFDESPNFQEIHG